ncbi:Coenzyme F420 hydrogenase/dehydrogenase, beta subunit C-terminal domain [Pseudobacteroides cellulosolvens]|uniref:Coenzyme F420 hydrogenase/dehydrogenase beta subunit domain protein n=1 Tax=Pseudobacteroides cellulosolvens ATCC 35603 = DSM 2933 TaxID=398512 RepID=A0A0L6JM27_9FIRM|nr:Coenzyme F420 hydrogenase/dehydrogenase, beta subunit C-terminal domain [Pseudobacteroides cellulosolvens]KNY26824.1 coenzyme F420 hydrogenase/dehydrogenase beta subunit domain protein [Pseudobacteroides cellulosolvens ATCC 35603 = DSM 2933]
MKNVYNSKTECYGCGGCKNICPKNAISMAEDEEGFLHPEINESLCNGCKLCVKVCPIKKRDNNKNFIKAAYAIKNKDEEIRKSSSSGGVFRALAKFVIDNKGIVFGAKFDNDFSVIHDKAESLEECKLFSGSKYLQSNTKNTYREVEQYLNEKKLVLYSGTPCQIYGLETFLEGKDISGLITCDIICHGTPSPLIFKEYINKFEKEYKSKIKNVNFRFKNDEAITNIKLDFETGATYINSSKSDEFYQLFLDSIISKPVCHSCKFANKNRVGDITLGDFWGIEEVLDNFDDNKGVSAVLINTEKGERIFENINKESLTIVEVKPEQVNQPQLYEPTPCYSIDDRISFWNSYQKSGYNKAVENFRKRPFIYKLKNKIRRILKR